VPKEVPGPLGAFSVHHPSATAVQAVIAREAACVRRSLKPCGHAACGGAVPPCASPEMRAPAVADHPRALLAPGHSVNPSLLEGLGVLKAPLDDHVGRVGRVGVAVRSQNLPEHQVGHVFVGGAEVRRGGLSEVVLGAVTEILCTLGGGGHREEYFLRWQWW